MPKKKKKVVNRDVKLLLNETVRHLGKVGDVVEVKPGYARNYLIPHGLALQPTKDNLKRIETKRKEYERIEAERRERQQKLLASLEGYEVSLERRANERGHLYGSVTASDIAFALDQAGVGKEYDEEITADEINLHGKIDRVDIFTADIRFADDLIQEIKVIVSPDPDSKALMDEYAAEQKAREQATIKAEADAAAAGIEA